MSPMDRGGFTNLGASQVYSPIQVPDRPSYQQASPNDNSFLANMRASGAYPRPAQASVYEYQPSQPAPNMYADDDRRSFMQHPGPPADMGGGFQQPNFNRNSAMSLQGSALSSGSQPAIGGSVLTKHDRDRLEIAKNELSQTGDFNLIDAFRIFDTEGKGWISPQQIREGLQNSLQYNIGIQEIIQFMKVFDKE